MCTECPCTVCGHDSHGHYRGCPRIVRLAPEPLPPAALPKMPQLWAGDQA